MKVITDRKKIEEVFERGVISQVLPEKEELLKRFSSGERLRIYIGADPTSTSLHLGHAQNYMVLEDFRKLGHEVIVLFGDFTAQIGDPTDKTTARKQLTEEEVKKNVKGWTDQIRPLMDFEDKENPPRVLFNSEWLSKMTWKDELELASNLTVQQMLERDMFEKRMEEGSPIYLHESQYPLMQGYDSVAMDVDIELCGTDQIFNALVGRTLLKRYKNKEKFVVATKLMEDPKTGELMSKSKGTGIFCASPPNEMYGAVMGQTDEMTRLFLVSNTRLPLKEIEEIMKLEPMEAKSRAALEIVKIFHGEESAKNAQEEFDSVFRKKGVPDDIKEIKLKKEDSLPEKLIEEGLIASKSEWRKLIEQGAVREGEEKITDIDFMPEKTTVLKIGKRRFVKISLQ